LIGLSAIGEPVLDPFVSSRLVTSRVAYCTSLGTYLAPGPRSGVRAVASYAVC